MNPIHNVWETHKKQLSFAMAATFFWGLLAHAYRFLNGNFCHDSLSEFHGAIYGNDHKIELGRIITPPYRDLFRSDVTLPWLIGVLSLVWIGLAIFLLVQIFRMENKKLVFLAAGIFTVNISVSATVATYIHDLDCYMFSMLCAVSAVWLWQERKWGWLPGAVMLTVSLGMYQSFLFTAVTLVMFRCILWLMEGESFATVLRRGLKAIGMILLGGIGYWVGLKVSTRLTGIALTSGGYNSLDTMKSITAETFLPLLAQTYRDCFTRLWSAHSTYPAVIVKIATAVLIVVSLAALGYSLKRMRWKEAFLLLTLTALLPLGANMIYVLTCGGSHDLMVYSIWLLWFFPLLLADWMFHKVKMPIGSWQKHLAMVMVTVLLYGSAVFANGMYLKKELEQNACLSLMTRVAARMEQTEAYIPGETPVVFYGTPELLNDTVPGMSDYTTVVGMAYGSPLCVPIRVMYQAYFDYILNTPVELADEDQWDIIYASEEMRAMPAYPQAGSVVMQDGVLVVKLAS